MIFISYLFILAHGKLCASWELGVSPPRTRQISENNATVNHAHHYRNATSRCWSSYDVFTCAGDGAAALYLIPKTIPYNWQEVSDAMLQFVTTEEASV